MDNSYSWSNLGDTVNNAFYFVVDKIFDLQGYFIDVAWVIGRYVFLIAVSLAALNYALTGTGLKENIIKILKATVFFFLVLLAYPKIVGAISSWTFSMAEKSIYPSVYSYFNGVVEKINKENVDYSIQGRSFTQYTITNVLKNDKTHLFDNLIAKKSKYTTVAPAAVFKIIFFIAGECFQYADNKDKKFSIVPEFSRILKGLLCGFFIIATGVFALLEYLICFLEFMLVASVGVILFPFTIWEGSKFMAEKFIGALLGFFIKLLFCNIAIFLMIYGFVSLLYIMSDNGFNGNVDQIIFIVFVCLMFFYICKSAPGIAQSLLTGTPSLSATGAISAVGGAVAAAGATMGAVKSTAGTIAGGATKAIVGGAGSLSEANAAGSSARNTVRDAGGDERAQSSASRSAFWRSLGSDVGDSFKTAGHTLTRSLLQSGNGGASGGHGGAGGGGTNPHSWRQDLLNHHNVDGSNQTFKEHFAARRQEGTIRGQESAKKYIKNHEHELPQQKAPSPTAPSNV